MLSKIPSFLKKPYNLVIIAMMIWVVVLNVEQRNWAKGKVFQHDVASYYAYLPAALIYNDLSLGYVDDYPELQGLVWRLDTPTGKHTIITSMGMAMLYSPFFLLAHGYALITHWPADGYSQPYGFAISFAALFYVIMGLIFLKKILLRWFSPWTTAFTLAAVFIGTNLFYYTTYEAAMSHAFNFSLIAVFLYYTIRWYDNPGSLKKIAGLGLLAGIIALVRPTNILVLLLFFLWGVNSFRSFSQRFVYYLKRPFLVIVMALCFILVWLPQLLYWKEVSGMFFYFSYGESGGKFFWDNPQIINILFSYKKGWFIYTPLMFLAFLGIFLLPKRIKGAFLPILLFQLINIYVLSSWWAWWFGGGFGLRSFVDTYAIMAIPFAALLSLIWKQAKYIKIPATAILVALIWFGFFQMRQYRTGAIHYWWMNKDAYWETFLKKKPTDRYWKLIKLPDYKAARKGIYKGIFVVKPELLPPGVYKHQFLEDFIFEQLRKQELSDSPGSARPDSLLRAEALHILSNPERALPYIKEKRIRDIEMEMREDPAYVEFIKQKAGSRNISVDDMFRIDAEWIYKRQYKSEE